MSFTSRQMEAYGEGMKVGRQLMLLVLEAVFADENASADVREEMEYNAMKMLCAAGGLQALMQPAAYISILPSFFRTICADIPEELLYRAQQSNTGCTDTFGLGFSLYIEDNLEEWDDWLFDNGFIDEEEYELRIEGDCANEREDG